MTIDINLWLAVAGAVVSAVVGLLTGVASAGWWLGTKSNEHSQLFADVKEIQTKCPEQHAELVKQLKEAVCSGFKLAIKELGADFEQKLSARDGRLAELDKASAVLAERMRQAEMDIEAIFGIFNRRDIDVGRQTGERRHGKDPQVL